MSPKSADHVRAPGSGPLCTAGSFSVRIVPLFGTIGTPNGRVPIAQNARYARRPGGPLAPRSRYLATPLTCGFGAGKLVEVAGVEPASSKLSAGLLRAQPARGSRAVNDHRPSVTAPARKGVPSGPRAGPSGESLKMTSVDRSSDWTGPDALFVLEETRQRVRNARWRLFVFPDFLRGPRGPSARFTCLESQNRNQAPPRSGLAVQVNISFYRLIPCPGFGCGGPGRLPVWRRVRPAPGACPTGASPGRSPVPAWPSRCGNRP